MGVKANTYRIGTQDIRERYSNRVQLLIIREDLEEQGDFKGPETFIVLEFQVSGAFLGKDELDSLSEAREEFDALVELIREEEGSDAVYPI